MENNDGPMLTAGQWTENKARYLAQARSKDVIEKILVHYWDWMPKGATQKQSMNSTMNIYEAQDVRTTKSTRNSIRLHPKLLLWQWFNMTFLDWSSSIYWDRNSKAYIIRNLSENGCNKTATSFSNKQMVLDYDWVLENKTLTCTHWKPAWSPKPFVLHYICKHKEGWHNRRIRIYQRG